MADDTHANTEPQQAAAETSDTDVNVQDADLPKAKDERVAGQPGEIDILMDTTIPVSAQLGQVEMEVQEI